MSALHLAKYRSQHHAAIDTPPGGASIFRFAKQRVSPCRGFSYPEFFQFFRELQQPSNARYATCYAARGLMFAVVELVALPPVFALR